MIGTKQGKISWPVWVAFTCVFFVLYFMCNKLASGEVTPFVYAFIISFVNFLGHIFLVVRARVKNGAMPLKFPTSALVIGLVVGVFITINDTSVLYMFKAGAPLSISMPVLASGSIFITILFGVLVLHERLSLKQGGGLACILLGIVMLNV